MIQIFREREGQRGTTKFNPIYMQNEFKDQQDEEQINLNKENSTINFLFKINQFTWLFKIKIIQRNDSYDNPIVSALVLHVTWFVTVMRLENIQKLV